MKTQKPVCRKIIPTWQNNPWYERSEEFYEKVYAGGECRYCRKKILTKLDFCDCAEMFAARERFKRMIAPRPVIHPQIKEETQEYNPDQFTEPAAGVPL